MSLKAILFKNQIIEDLIIDIHKKFGFTIYVTDLNTTDKCVEDRLFESGCNDALLCSINDNLYLEFMRAAENLHTAILSAIENIQLAGCKYDQILVENELYTCVEKIRALDCNLNQTAKTVAPLYFPIAFPP